MPKEQNAKEQISDYLRTKTPVVLCDKERLELLESIRGCSDQELDNICQQRLHKISWKTVIIGKLSAVLKGD